MFKYVRSNKVLPCVFSDHDFVDLEFCLEGFSNKRGGVWRFNTAVLADPEFKREISSIIDRQKSVISDFDSLGAWWDDLKLVIRSTCINYCSRKRQSINRERNFLTKRLIRAKNAFHAGDDSVVSQLLVCESALSSLGRDLFAKDDPIDMQIQTDLIDSLESLTDIERASCEGLFTKDEIFSALKGLQTGKSPGSDGLPIEFYLAFSDDLGDFLVLVLNERYRLGVLTYSQRESLLRLLYKKDD